MEKGNKTRKRLIIGAGIVIAVALAVYLGTYFKFKSDLDAVAEDVIYNNIYVEGIDVSGMTAEDVKQALEEQLADLHAEKAILTREEEQVEVTLGELGLEMANVDEVIGEAVSYGKSGSVWERHSDVEVLAENPLKLEAEYKINSEAATTTLSSIAENMGTAPQNATITRENGAFVVTEDVKGIQVDVASSVEEIAAYFTEAWEHSGEETFELVSIEKEADITSEELSQIKDTLGSFTTTYTSGNNRAKNIALAASRIDGTVLMPGEEFSASDGMGTRTAANGYLEAGAYLNGAVIQSYGGGVCQVSTTLYNAVLNAELEVTMRYSHSMVVDYVPAAKDAAIAEGSKDLKFKNNTEHPVYISGYTSGGSITFVIYGVDTRAENRDVEYVSKTLSTTEATSKFTATSEYELGTIKRTSSGHTGKKAELWKVVYENGVEVSREKVNSSSYVMSPNHYKVGVASSNAQAASIVKNAVSSQDRSTIEAAISQAKALIAAENAAATPPAESAAPEAGGAENTTVTE